MAITQNSKTMCCAPHPEDIGTNRDRRRSDPPRTFRRSVEGDRCSAPSFIPKKTNLLSVCVSSEPPDIFAWAAGVGLPKNIGGRNF